MKTSRTVLPISGVLLLAALPCLAARTGDMHHQASLAVLDTYVHTALPSALASLDTVVRQLQTGAGGNLNTTPRGTTFIIR